MKKTTPAGRRASEGCYQNNVTSDATRRLHAPQPCAICGDPAYGSHCGRCRAWDDLYLGMTTMDGQRLARGLAHFRHRRRMPVEALLRKILRRVNDLEFDAVEFDTRLAESEYREIP